MGGWLHEGEGRTCDCGCTHEFKQGDEVAVVEYGKIDFQNEEVEYHSDAADIFLLEHFKQMQDLNRYVRGLARTTREYLAREKEALLEKKKEAKKGVQPC